MNILLLDTSYNKLQFSLYQISADTMASSYTDEQNFAFQVNVNYVDASEPRRHGEIALNILDQLLKQAQLTLDDIEYFAYNRGPGSFVGTRIAATMVLALAEVAPQFHKLLALSGLEMQTSHFKLVQLQNIKDKNTSILNRQIESRLTKDTKIIVAYDANMSEAYGCIYELGDKLRCKQISTEQLFSLQDLAIFISYVISNQEERKRLETEHQLLSPTNIQSNNNVILTGNAWTHYLPRLEEEKLLTSEQVKMARELFQQQQDNYHHQIVEFAQNFLAEERTDHGVSLDQELIFATGHTSLQLPLILSYIKEQRFTPLNNIEVEYVRNQVTG